MHYRLTPLRAWQTIIDLCISGKRKLSKEQNGRTKEILPRLKNLIVPMVLILIIAGVVASSIVTGFPFSRMKWIARGGDYDRNSVVSELHYYYNYPGERSVVVEAQGRTIKLKFVEEKLKSVRRGFYSRHRDDFSRYYDAGFDTMIVEAVKEGGGIGTIKYDLLTYRFR